MLTGENGVLGQAMKAKELTNISNEREAIELIITLANEEKLDENNKYNIGKNLYDKNVVNSTKWDIIQLIDNKEIYGTGWNYIKKDTEIEEYGKTQYEWLVNYSSGEIIQLEENKYIELSFDADLAVKDGIILNIDAKNMSDEDWPGIVKHGNVKYNGEEESLYFDGDEDYLELLTPGDFSNGFTFEIYANLNRLAYDNGSGRECLGMFCRMPSLQSDYRKAMRFGVGYPGHETLCKFFEPSSWVGSGEKLKTTSDGAVVPIDGNVGYKANEDFYLTFVYRTYDNTPSTVKSELNWTEKADRVDYYINGELYGYTYYGIDSYKNGCGIWNKDSCPFFIGVCPWNKNGSLYYLKGNIYSCRLYNKSLTNSQVLENCNKTIAYHEL